MGMRLIRRFRDLLDVDFGAASDGDVPQYDAGSDTLVMAPVVSGGGTAATTTFSPAGNIAATDVQDALEELDAEKAALAHAHAGEDITSGTVADARIASTIARDSEVSSAVSAEATARDAAIAVHTGDATAAHAASAIAFTPAGSIAATDVQAAIEEAVAEVITGAPTGADYLVGTANGGLSAEIVVGTSPGGELGGTWASPTVDATHSGSSHASVQSAAEATAAAALSAHEAASDPHPGYTTAAELAAFAQPLDSDLTAIAALSTTSFGRGLLELANQAALLSAAGAQASDSDLTAIAGLSPTNDDVIQRKAGAWTNRTLAQLIADLAALGTTFQPLDSDLTAIAALSTTSFGRSLLTQADAAATRALLDLEAGTDFPSLTTFNDHSARHENGGADEISLAGLDGTPQALTDHLGDTSNAHDASSISFVPTGTIAAANAQDAIAEVASEAQPLDSDLTAIAGLSPTNDDVIQRKAGAWTNRTLAQLIADLAALGTTFQPLDSDLTAFAGLSIAADKLPYGNGSHTLALADLTSFARTLLDDADASTVLSTLGVSTFIKTLLDDADAVTARATLGVPTDGWTDDSAATWTRTANQTFTVSGDRTAVFTKGTRLKWTQTTVKYGTVVGSSHSAGTTTVTIATTDDYVLTAAAISANYYSYAANPAGYPTYFNFTPTYTGFSSAPSGGTVHFSIIGSTCWFSHQRSNGTSNANSFTITTPMTITSVFNQPLQVTDNGTIQTSPGLASFGSGTTIALAKTLASGVWTTSGAKNASGVIVMEF